MKWVRSIIIVLLSLILSVLISMLVILSTKKDANHIYRDTYKSIVEVKACNDKGCSYGSGVIISDDGKIISNNHVITYQDEILSDISIRLSYRDDYYEVQVIKTDVELDLALLKVECDDLSAIKFAKDNSYDYGDKVYAIGNSNNRGIGINEGIISNPKMNVISEATNREVIEANIVINEGNSGGALVNEKGKLIGITTFRMKDSSNNVIYGVAYSIPINQINAFIG